MKQIGWKIAFTISGSLTTFWFLQTIVAGLLHQNDPSFSGQTAALVCLFIGVVTVPVMLLLTAYLARQAFRGR